jgi:RNA polymerase primary sigma factor
MPALPRTSRYVNRNTAGRTPFDVYFAEINETPLLNAAEEKELAYRIQEGDAEARDHLACANLRLVVNIARPYVGKGMDLADLIAEGNLGLMRATETFDPSMNTRFSTYASYWIRQSIKRGLINTGKTIRLPAYANDLINKWRRATVELREELGRPPTPEEVGHKLNLSRRKLTIVKKALEIHNAVPQAAADDEGPTSVSLLADENTRPPDAGLVQSDEMRRVFALLDQLGVRAQNVLRLRFGLDDTQPRTLQEIGALMGLTRERVRQIEREALATLRDLLGGE